MTALTISPDGTNREWRWTAMRKAAVVAAVESGAMNPAEACARHGLSAEELAAWRRDYAAHGANGLRASQLQANRGRRP